MARKVLLATNNEHKVSEIKGILGDLGFEFVTLREAGIDSDPVEDAETFEGNARIKAQAAQVASGGLAVIADDSGLVVDALQGAPGVHSSRFAGDDATDEQNNALLLQQLADVGDEDRGAAFVCTIVFLGEDGSELVAQGEVRGRIGHEPSEGGVGFGYDPLFLPDEFADGRTFADGSQAEKDAISHRGRALRKLASYMLE